MGDPAEYFLRERYRGLGLLQRLPQWLAGEVQDVVGGIIERGAHPEFSWEDYSQELMFWADPEMRDRYLARDIFFPFYSAVGEDRQWRSFRRQAPLLEKLAEQYSPVGVELLEQLWIERGRGMLSALPGPSEQKVRWRSVAHMAPDTLSLNIDAGLYAAAIVTPRCGIGGSEKVMREMIAAIERLTGLPSLTIVADTEVAPELLPQHSICLPNLKYRGVPFLRNPIPARVQAVKDVILQAGVKRVIVINSFVGNTLLMDGALQEQGIRTASAMFCVAIGAGGAIEGYVQIADWLIDAGVTLFTDNQHMARMMASGNFYDGTVVLNMPEIVTRASTPRGKNVLWAGRIDSQKRPDLLLKIARESPHIDYEVWGVPLLSDETLMDSIIAQPNIEYRGGFDGFASIDKASVGCLLYTSGYDGTPNLLLEAMACGLPCVASAVGGIPDLMSEGRGLLVGPDEPPQAYVAQLDRLLGDQALCERLATHGREYIASSHSLAGFDRDVARLLSAL